MSHNTTLIVFYEQEAARRSVLEAAGTRDSREGVCEV